MVGKTSGIVFERRNPANTPANVTAVGDLESLTTAFRWVSTGLQRDEQMQNQQTMANNRIQQRHSINSAPQHQLTN